MEDTPRGWRFFRFILTPGELAQVLETFHLVQCSCQVSVGCREMPAEAFLASCRPSVKIRQAAREDVPRFYAISQFTDK